jgi:hypothetical protein
LKLLSLPGDKLQSKVAASDELTQGSLGELSQQTTETASTGLAGVMGRLQPSMKPGANKAVSSAVNAAGTAYAMKTASLTVDEVKSLIERFLNGETGTTKVASEKTARVKTVAHGLTGRGKVGLIGGAMATPYLYSGHVQQKARKGGYVSGTEATLARNPGVAAVAAGVAAAKGNTAVARKLWERGQKRLSVKTAEDRSGISSASRYNNLEVVGILRYGEDPELVDEAIIAGLCKIAERISL